MTDDLITRLKETAGYNYGLYQKECAEALEAKDRRIAELEEEIDRNDEWAKGFIEKTDARIAELEAALLPFAAIADESTANLADNYMYPDCYPMSAFRAARAALEKTPEG